jgi:endonuclease YncB( thermonuclease family)
VPGGFLVGCLLASALVAVEPPYSLTGKVVAVADGDTLTILVDRTQHKIRVANVDCPERGQPFGTRAKQLTSALAFGKTVTARVLKVDRYERLVAEVAVPTDEGHVDLSEELVRAGLAWWYRKYAPDEEQLEALEAEARKENRGLWAHPDPMAPWEWRQIQRARWVPEEPQKQPTAGGYWLNTSSGVRHNRSCEWFGKTKRGRPCGPEDGKPCGICGG